MDVLGTGVSKAGFSFFEVSRNLAKLIDVHACFCLDEPETLPDGRAGGAAFASDGRKAESINAIHAKDGEHAGRIARSLRVELVNQRERTGGDIFIVVARLRREFGKKFARMSVGEAERAFGGETDIGIEGEEGSVGTGQEFVRDSVDIFCGGREENESLAQSREQFEQHSPEPCALVLNCEDDWHGVNGP